MMSKRYVLPSVAFLATLIVVVSLGYAFKTKQDLQKARDDLQKIQTTSQENELGKLIEEIGKLIVLPENEIPTFATVTDVANLKQNQQFFSKAENGDKVLVYSQAKKAILYRPSINKVVEVGPVNVVPSPTVNATPSPTTPTPTPVRLVLYNGTKTLGLTKKAAASLEGKISNFEVVAKENASQDYTETLVIDLTGTNKDLADQLAGLLKGKTGTLPEEETKPEADILVILGTDYSAE